MTQKALLQSAGDGTAVPQGYVGQQIAITGQITNQLNVNSAQLSSNETPSSGVYLWVGVVAFGYASTPAIGNYQLASIRENPGIGVSVLSMSTQIPTKTTLADANLALPFSTVFVATGSNKPTLWIEAFASVACNCTFVGSKLIRIA